MRKSETTRWCAAMVAGAMTIALSGCVIVFPDPPQAEEDFSLSTSFDDVDLLRVRWVNGDVTIDVGTSGSTISAVGTKRVVAASQTEANAAIDDIEISFETSDSFPNRRTLRFESPNSTLGITYGGDVRVSVPSGVRIELENVNGSVLVTGNVGTTGVELINGNVDVINQVGDTTVDVRNGAVDVSSTNGDVMVDVDNGSIDVAASPTAEGMIDASTAVGSVEILVPAEFAAALELVGPIGEIATDFEGFDVTALSTSPGRITATLNGGGGNIHGSAAVGSVQFGPLE